MNVSVGRKSEADAHDQIPFVLLIVTAQGAMSNVPPAVEGVSEHITNWREGGCLWRALKAS